MQNYTPLPQEDTSETLHDEKCTDTIIQENTPDTEKYPHTTTQSNDLFSKANFFSKLFFIWIQPLISLGYKRPIEADDVPDIPSEIHSSVIGDELYKAWEQTKNEGESHWYLALTLWRLWGKFVFLEAAFPQLIVVVFLHVLEPTLTSLLIQYTANPEAEFWEGILYALAVLGVMVVRCVAQARVMWTLLSLELKVKIGLTTLIYRKSLRLSNVSKGNATNLLSVDPNQVGFVAWQFHEFWSMPLSLILATFMLYQLLGWPTFVALGFMCLLAPMNRWIVNKLDFYEKKIMYSKDNRVKKLTEIFQGILIVKLFSWEDKMKDRIQSIRSTEVQYLKKFSFSLATLSLFFQLFSSIATAIALSIYVLQGNTLGADKIFPALIVFGNITRAVLLLPSMSSKMSESKISLMRLNQFLRRPELEIDRDDMLLPNMAVCLQNASFVHYDHDKDIEDDRKEGSPEQEPVPEPGLEYHFSRFKLRNLTFTLRSGQLVAVVGPVGSGKSSFLYALLGEMRKESGIASLTGSVCLASQQPWIRNMTFRDNILFGLPYIKKKYNMVLQQCALTDDLKIFPAGDQTEIGEKGINLSGGQKQRVSLARALYSDQDIYFLDDPLSALDTHVGAHLFQECILKGLKGKTRVLVTHQLQYLPRVDYIYIFEKGTICRSGTYVELVNTGYDFSTIIHEINPTSEPSSSSSHPPSLRSSLGIPKDEVGSSSHPPSLRSSLGIPKDEVGSSPKTFAKSLFSKEEDVPEDTHKDHFVKEEEHVHGALGWNVYRTYLLSVGGITMAVFISLIWILIEATNGGRSLWLSYWSDGVLKPDPGISLYLGVYFGLTVLNAVAAVVENYSWFYMALNSAVKLHEQMLHSVLRAPLQFFHTTPTGRIINRFSKDQLALEQDLPDMFNDLMNSIVSVVMVLITIAIIMPWIFVGLVPIALVYYYLQLFFRETSRELSRLKSISNSPIFSQYNETIQGLETIRAYNHQKLLLGENHTLINCNTTYHWFSFACNRWFTIRMEILGAVVSFSACIIIVLSKNIISTGSAGLILMLTETMAGYYSFLIRIITMLETSMPSVERIKEYIAAPQEGGLMEEEILLPPEWPTNGKIQFCNVSMRYRQETKPVLKSLTFTILPREKIGIIGRTGAGKSSIMNVLFRLVELMEGTILLDDVDISKIRLQDLRRNISVIPQDPVLFSGTIRNNLDPFDQYEDYQIWQVLERVHLQEFVKQLSGNLQAEVIEGGHNLSVGQRQLMCLGRAILRDSKILIMDEATASVDNHTDSLIQTTIHQEFVSKTVLTVAHRLHTVLDSDRVMVMEQGELKEFDTPAKLLHIPSSLFASYVAAAGIAPDMWPQE